MTATPQQLAQPAMFRTLNVHLFAGPGVGKSTTMAVLYAELKMLGLTVEMAPEYAKELFFDGKLADTPQDLIVAEQVRRQRRYQGKVQVVLTDAPPIASVIYATPEEYERIRSIVALETGGWETLNILLHRDLRSSYESVGRHQSVEEAERFHQERLVPFLRANLGDTLIEQAVGPAMRDELVGRIQRRLVRLAEEPPVAAQAGETQFQPVAESF